MALDPSARESNVRDSIRKFFVDNVSPHYQISFDKGLTIPKIQGSPSEIDKWVSINFGSMERSDLSEHTLIIFCCTRRDNEGFKLAQLTDGVMGYLSDTTMTDGMKRIPLYRSYENQAWSLIGAMLVQEIMESEQFIAPDETKYKVLNVRLRWSSKI